jgi:hypothetical protein
MDGDKADGVANRRAELMVRLACDLLGLADIPEVDALQLPLSVTEFQQELRRRYAAHHPQLVIRSEATIERARLIRSAPQRLPRVVLRQGAPRRMTEP